MGPSAMICIWIGWRHIRNLTRQDRWLAGIILGAITFMVLLLLIALLAILTMLRGDLKTINMIYMGVLGTGAVLISLLCWRQMKKRAKYGRYLAGCMLSVGIAVILVFLYNVAFSAG